MAFQCVSESARSAMMASGRSTMTLYRRRTASCKPFRVEVGVATAEVGEISGALAAIVFDQFERAVDASPAAPLAGRSRRGRRRSTPCGSRADRPRTAAPPGRPPSASAGTVALTALAACSSPVHSAGVRQVDRT